MAGPKVAFVMEGPDDVDGLVITASEIPGMNLSLF